MVWCFHRGSSSNQRLRNIAINFGTHLILIASRATLESLSKLRNGLVFIGTIPKIYHKVSIKIIKKFLCIKLNTNGLILFLEHRNFPLVAVKIVINFMAAINEIAKLYKIGDRGHKFLLCILDTIIIIFLYG